VELENGLIKINTQKAHIYLVIRDLHTHEREDFPRTTKKDKDTEEFIK